MKSTLLMVVMGIMVYSSMSRSTFSNKSREKIRNRMRHRMKSRKSSYEIAGESDLFPYTADQPRVEVRAITESMDQSPVDLRPWNYKMMDPQAMFRSRTISKQDPESYNMNEDTSKPNGCNAQEEEGVEIQKEKRTVYSADPHAYYDPTELMKLTNPTENVYDVPVILMKEVQGDREKELEAQKKALHGKDSTYYNPIVDSPKYEIDALGNTLDGVFDRYKDTIKSDRKSTLYSEAEEDKWVDDVARVQLKIPHKQDIPIKNMRAVDAKIQHQKNKILMEKLKDEKLPKMKQETPTRRRRRRF